jgi:hypothetical protein
MLWLALLGLMLGALFILGVVSRGWRRPPQAHLGWMSQGWLEDHRANTRYRVWR